MTSPDVTRFLNATVVFSQSVACTCKLEAMKAENRHRQMQGKSDAYGEEEFFALIEEYGLAWQEKEKRLAELEELKEHYLKEVAQLRVEKKRDEKRIAELEGELEEVMNEACQIGFDEQTPNRVGQPVSTEPTPSQAVRSAFSRLLKRIAELARLLKEGYDLIASRYPEEDRLGYWAERTQQSLEQKEVT